MVLRISFFFLRAGTSAVPRRNHLGRIIRHSLLLCLCGTACSVSLQRAQGVSFRYAKKGYEGGAKVQPNGILRESESGPAKGVRWLRGYQRQFGNRLLRKDSAHLIKGST